MSRDVIQHVRAYTEEREEDADEDAGGNRVNDWGHSTECLEERRILESANAPDPLWRFVFDIETTADAAQSPRLGTYAVYGLSKDDQRALYRHGVECFGDGAHELTRDALDVIHDAGIFYFPDAIEPDEIAGIQHYAATHTFRDMDDSYPPVRLRCMDRDEFVKDVFYEWIHEFRRALCIGHNLQFDLSRLASEWWPCRASGKDEIYKGGFSLKLCTCRRRHCGCHPPVRVKHLGGVKSLFKFSMPEKRDSKGEWKPNWWSGEFLDTATFASSLLEIGSLSLENLTSARVFNTKHKKESRDDHGGPISSEYLDYALNDVQGTWEVYQEERELYRQYKLDKLPSRIFSGAGLGRAHLEKIGVPRFMKQHPEFPRERIGQAMQGYYGGRTDIGIRQVPTEVLVCDYTSQYPTVNALMKLQELHLAECIEVRDCTDQARAWLASPDLLEQLQGPNTWPLLRRYVRVLRSEDILPARTPHGAGMAATNIGVDYVSSDLPVWHALPDVVASVLLTGKVPKILEAWEPVAIGQVPTTALDLFGDERYHVDLGAGCDLFTRLMDLRTSIKGTMKQSSGTERYRLDAQQTGLTIVANAASYGLQVEIDTTPRINTRNEPPYTLLIAHDSVGECRAAIKETPGNYFSPWGALIPAGGRLLLAIAERLGRDRGIHYALCDTDSMAFARPETDNMRELAASKRPTKRLVAAVEQERQDFRDNVELVRAWFGGLSPYAGSPNIFEMKDENYRDGRLEPLYALCVSPKRYVLYNRCDNGQFRIRKFSSHGTGGYRTPKIYTPDPSIPSPYGNDETDALNAAELGGAQWLYELWYDFICRVENGHDSPFVMEEATRRFLLTPDLFHVKITTPHMLETYKHIPGIRPFNFFSIIPALDKDTILLDGWDEGHFLDTIERRKFSKEEWSALRSGILAEGGLRPSCGFTRSDIPRSVLRHGGLDIDVMASLYEFNYADEFLDHVKNVQRGYTSTRSRTRSSLAELRGVTYYAPFTDSLDKVRGEIRRRDTNEVVDDLPFKKMFQSLRRFFDHPNTKAENPTRIGRVERQHLRVVGHRLIGKESNEIVDDASADSNGVIPAPDSQVFADNRTVFSLKDHTVKELAQSIGLSDRTAERVRASQPVGVNTERAVELWVSRGKPPFVHFNHGRKEPVPIDAVTLREKLQPYSRSATSRSSCVARKTVADFMNGTRPRPETLERLAHGLSILEPT